MVPVTSLSTVPFISLANSRSGPVNFSFSSVIYFFHSFYILSELNHLLLSKKENQNTKPYYPNFVLNYTYSFLNARMKDGVSNIIFFLCFPKYSTISI